MPYVPAGKPRMAKVRAASVFTMTVTPPFGLRNATGSIHPGFVRLDAMRVKRHVLRVLAKKLRRGIQHGSVRQRRARVRRRVVVTHATDRSPLPRRYVGAPYASRNSLPAWRRRH